MLKLNSMMHEKCMWSGLSKISLPNYYYYYRCYSHHVVRQAVPVWDAVMCFGLPLCPSAWHPVDTRNVCVMHAYYLRKGGQPLCLDHALLAKAKHHASQDPSHFLAGGSSPSRPRRLGRGLVEGAPCNIVSAALSEALIFLARGLFT